MRVVDGAEAALSNADVCITMTTARTPYVQASWIAPGSLLVQVAANEVDAAVILQADRIVVDEWEQIRHFPRSAFRPLIQSGRVSSDDITHLGAIVAGRAEGRRDPEEADAIRARIAERLGE